MQTIARPWMGLALVAFVVTVGYLDGISGEKIHLTQVYALAAVTAGWFGGLRPLILIVLSSTGTQVITDLSDYGRSYAWFPAINQMVGTLTWLGVGLGAISCRRAMGTIADQSKNLRRQNQELESLNEEKNHLVGMAAHDLRNPLTVISGYAKFLDGNALGPLNIRQREALTQINEAARRMLHLLNDLLDVSHLESGHLALCLEDIDPRSFFLESLHLLRYHAESKEITLESTVEEPLPELIRVDKGKMCQVVENLISNALKYSNRQTCVRARLRTTAEHLELEVSDQGQGIPEVELGRLFEPFHRATARATEGESSTGLGLAIVKRIVEGHGGKISVHSQVGQGTRFTVTISLRAISPASVRPPENSQRHRVG